MANLSRYTDVIWNLDTSYYFNDFFNYTTATDGVSSFNVSGTTVAGSSRSGVAVLTTGAVQNQNAAVFMTNACFILAANKPIYGRALVQYTEANVDDAAAFVGFMSAPVAATTNADATGAVRTTGTIAGVYKLPNETVWHAVSRNGSQVTDTTSTKTAGGAAAQKIEVMLTDWDGVSVQVTYKVDDEFLRDVNGLVIRHTLLIASAVIMSFGANVKAPLAAANSEVMNVDYIYAHQLR